MPIRIDEIARKHKDDAESLLTKAKALGFRATGIWTTLDRITAEALELAVYGSATAVRFDLPHIPGSEGLLRQLRSLLATVKGTLAKKCLDHETVNAARLLARVLSLSRSKDWSDPPPPEWEAAESVIRQLDGLGISIKVEELPRKGHSRRSKGKRATAAPSTLARTRKVVQTVRRELARRSKTKKTKGRKPWLLFTPFERSRRHH
jgi:hypothetical protein